MTAKDKEEVLIMIREEAIAREKALLFAVGVMVQEMMMKKGGK